MDNNKAGKEYSNADVKYTGYNKEFKNQKNGLAKELDKLLRNDMAKINPQFPMFYEKAMNYLRTREALNRQVYNIKRYSKTEYPRAKAEYDILMEHRYEVYDLYQEYKTKAKKERKETGINKSGYSNFFCDKQNTLIKIFKENVNAVEENKIIKTIRTVIEEKNVEKEENVEEKSNKEFKSKLVPPIRPIDALVGYEPDTVLRSYCKKADYELLSELGDELLKVLLIS